jgi:hypothetical protein
MSIPYSGPFPGEDSNFADLRDSFYLLMNFNQYKLKPLISMTKEAEGLLRIALFSKDLKLLGMDKTLNQMRRKLAATLRSNRRKGTVPVFISTLWFLFSVGISVEGAFGYLGSNSQAHDLAMGLFMGWFPVLIMCSIVDRNPVASDDIRRKLNKLVDLTCMSLQDPETRGDFVASFSDLPEAQKMAYWVQKISRQAPLIKGNFFCGFAGQGRTRFHYGAAHAILIDIEKSYVADHGRGWLSQDERAARASLVLGQSDTGFVWFDGRQFWQISCAVLLVTGPAAGAFILSYFTPTVGLGCRTGGYLIFIVVAFSLLLLELLVWYLTSPIRKKEVELLIRQRSSLSNGPLGEPKNLSFPGLAASKTTLEWIITGSEAIAVSIAIACASVLPMKHRTKKLERVETRVRNHFAKLRRLTTRQWAERCFFTPVEFINMSWLCYLLMAQTVGAFVNCRCQTSSWASTGGYLDFTQWNYTNNDKIAKYWIAGTVVSTVVMGVGMVYVVLEWCLQAHMCTEDYKDAMNGLWRVRRFRLLTFWVRYPASLAALTVNGMLRRLGLRKSAKRKALVWTKNSRFMPRVGDTMIRLASEMHSLPFQSIGKEEQSPATKERHGSRHDSIV